MSEEQIFNCLELLSFATEIVGFRDDFKEMVVEYYVNEIGQSEPYGRMVSNDLWDNFQKGGLIKAFSEYNGGKKNDETNPQYALVYMIKQVTKNKR